MSVLDHSATTAEFQHPISRENLILGGAEISVRNLMCYLPISYLISIPSKNEIFWWRASIYFIGRNHRLCIRVDLVSHSLMGKKDLEKKNI